jgi:membrane protein
MGRAAHTGHARSALGYLQGAVIPNLIRRIDQFQQRHAVLGFPLAVVKKFGEDQAGKQAALIAYYGFFSLFPLLLVFVTVLGFVLHGNVELQHRVISSVKDNFPYVGRYLKVGAISGNTIALVVGIAGALWAGLGVTNAAQDAMNTVWDVPLARRPNFWKSRLRGLGLLALLGTTALASTFLSGLGSTSGSFSAGMRVLGVVGSLTLNLVLYWFAFQVLTVKHLTVREVLPGAILGAVLWTGLQFLGSYYVTHQVANAQPLYGSFAVVIGLLAWIYLGAQLTLYAAEVNVVRAEHLWPRSLTGPPSTEADREALARLAREASRMAGELVEVHFEAPDEATRRKLEAGEAKDDEGRAEEARPAS